MAPFGNQNQKQRVGEIRPSQMLYTYGVGATIDLPNLSVMVMGLDEWQKDLCLPLNEERLLATVKRVLGAQVQELRQPPFVQTEWSADNQQNLFGAPVAPFPGWVVCPKCRLLAPLQRDLFTLKSDRFARPDRMPTSTPIAGAWRSRPPSCRQDLSRSVRKATWTIFPGTISYIKATPNVWACCA